MVHKLKCVSFEKKNKEIKFIRTEKEKIGENEKWFLAA